MSSCLNWGAKSAICSALIRMNAIYVHNIQPCVMIMCDLSENESLIMSELESLYSANAYVGIRFVESTCVKCLFGGRYINAIPEC